ncbi:MAG: hypothetical protein JSS93_15090 [Bacteroidetes bacterium]|nr:hypothetical protein [Bacteroidota bacterium]
MPLATITEAGKEILLLDYRGCNEHQMLQLLSEAKEWLEQQEQPSLLLSVFNDHNYATGAFMKMVVSNNQQLDKKIKKQAVVGLNAVKKMILKGFNYLIKRNVRAFDTQPQAIAFLLDEDTTDRDLPEYLH